MGYLLSLSESQAALLFHASEIALLVFGILLAVGIAGEYRKPLPSELASEWTKTRRLRRHEKAFKWLVIVGVTMESFSEAGIFVSSSRLQAIADEKIAQARLELETLKTPRSLVHIPEMIASLELFTGTEYTFSCVFEEEESIQFLGAIDGLLQRTGWKRVKPPGGFPAIKVFGKDVDFAVPLCLKNAVIVSIDSEQPTASLLALTLGEMPAYVRAAIALNANLSSNTFPPHEDNVGKKVDIQQGPSRAVRIGVGKKPQ